MMRVRIRTNRCRCHSSWLVCASKVYSGLEPTLLWNQLHTSTSWLALSFSPKIGKAKIGRSFRALRTLDILDQTVTARSQLAERANFGRKRPEKPRASDTPESLPRRHPAVHTHLLLQRFHGLHQQRLPLSRLLLLDALEPLH
jgi:hypothetical protein